MAPFAVGVYRVPAYQASASLSFAVGLIPGLILLEFPSAHPFFACLPIADQAVAGVRWYPKRSSAGVAPTEFSGPSVGVYVSSG